MNKSSPRCQRNHKVADIPLRGESLEDGAVQKQHKRRETPHPKGLPVELDHHSHEDQDVNEVQVEGCPKTVLILSL